MDRTEGLAVSPLSVTTLEGYRGAGGGARFNATLVANGVIAAMLGSFGRFDHRYFSTVAIVRGFRLPGGLDRSDITMIGRAAARVILFPQSFRVLRRQYATSFLVHGGGFELASRRSTADAVDAKPARAGRRRGGALPL